MQDAPPQPVPGPSAGAPGREPGPASTGPVGDPYSSMAERFNWPFRWFARRFFQHFELDPKQSATLRSLETGGAVVYVMRYASRLDYFLLNTLFLRDGLRLSRFANGFRFYYYRPISDAVKLFFGRPRTRPREVEHKTDRRVVRQLIRSGDSFFLFLHTAQQTTLRRAGRRREDELDLLLEVVRATWGGDKPVSVVPLALFWRKGPRAENRFLNLNYGGQTRPSDLAKVASFLATYRSLSVKIGAPTDLRSFIEARRSEGPQMVARKARRAMLLYFYREEKIVQGPTLRSRHRVLEEVLRAPRVEAEIKARASRRRGSPERARRDAEKIFFEISANMNSTFLAALAAIAGWTFKRMFASIEVSGLDRVAEYARWNPIVLVPNHRSYLDFVIVSWLFYSNYLVPPHIYARDNMKFGPFGAAFRGVGAFFARGSFDDLLYKEIFRAYVGYLVRQGVTQEFFIEGGRSRTGKTLAPRFGMLSWDVEAFLQGNRRDLFFVPVGITYERLVEEGSLVEQQRGGAKAPESVLGLVRARKFLLRRFGTAHLNFGEPISLSAALGPRRRELAQAEPGEKDAEKRRFVEDLAHRIVERINCATAANATAVAATVLLGSKHAGLRRDEFVLRMSETVELLRLQDVRLTQALQTADEAFEETVGFLERAGLVRVTGSGGTSVISCGPGKRAALDLYRNSIVHFFAAPSFLARRLLAGPASLATLREDLATWQDFLYREYFMPRGEVLAAHFEAYVEHFEECGWIRVKDAAFVVTPEGEGSLESLASQTRGILEVYQTLFEVFSGSETDWKRREVQKRAKATYERAELLGEVRGGEALNDTTLSNAIDLLLRLDVIEEDREAKPNPRDPSYVRGEAHASLDGLRARLATALAGR